VLGCLLLFVLVGLVVLWPSGEAPELTLQGVPRDTESAEVVSVEDVGCPEGSEGTCGEITVRLTSGDREGETGTINQTVPRELGLDPEISPGDDLRVIPPPGTVEGQTSTYILAGFDRQTPMVILALGLGLLVIALGRLRGALSLLGLVISLIVILLFVVPAILRGEEPLLVALVGAAAVMLATILVAHGLTLKSVGAILGTTASLLLVAVLAVAFTSLTHLTGFSSAEGLNLSYQAGLDLKGLVLAGMLIGALGVLDDITVSQASTVLALRSASPKLPFGSLYRRASEVGRDHASAAVNTLVLAYAGAALPILLIFGGIGIGFTDAVNLEVVAKEVVAMLAGSVGVVAAVPLTTALTAWLALQFSADELPAEEGHVH
jgi:uncharacterized membrane protein